jgi:putative endopeptidase
MSSLKAAVVAGVAVLGLCSFVAGAASQPASSLEAPAAVDLTTAPRMGTWGFDLAGRDTSVSPGADFYRYANGHYTDQMQIPSDRARYGAFDALQALTEQRQRAILERAAANTAATGDEARIGAFYRSFMDETRIERLGPTPIRGDLAAVRAARTREQLAALMGRANLGFTNSFFQAYISPDERAPTRYAVNITQAGLGLPDRDYYLQPQFAEIRTAYRDYIAQMLRLVNWPQADAQASAILAMETQIAQASWTRAQSREADRTYNPVTRAELQRLAPEFPWAPYLAANELPGVQRVILNENTAIAPIAHVFATTPVATLQAWQAFSVVDQSAPYLSRPFVDAHFGFRIHRLSGQPEQRPRWKRAVSTVSNNVGEAVGRLYVAAYFPPRSQQIMQDLVGDLRRAMAARIERLTWMSPATRQRALAKLASFNVKIGYPSRWRDYSALTINDQDLWGNVQRSTAFEWTRQVRRLDQPVDREEWLMTPQTVNAYYSQTRNEIVFPAAILQPPFFDPDADPAVNYGAIGGVIGHEITHGFDDQGRKYDGTGTLADWWAPEDATRFQEQTRRLGAQYGAFEPVSGMHINGDLTMGENVADLGGLLLALDAYHLHMNGRPSVTMDGYNGEQRVFLGWAQVWRSRSRDDFLRRQLVSDPHSPERFRVLGPVRNIDAWYTAFNIQPSDPLYIPPEQRVRIW